MLSILYQGKRSWTILDTTFLGWSFYRLVSIFMAGSFTLERHKMSTSTVWLPLKYQNGAKSIRPLIYRLQRLPTDFCYRSHLNIDPQPNVKIVNPCHAKSICLNHANILTIYNFLALKWLTCVTSFIVKDTIYIVYIVEWNCLSIPKLPLQVGNG